MLHHSRRKMDRCCFLIEIRPIFLLHNIDKNIKKCYYRRMDTNKKLPPIQTTIQTKFEQPEHRETVFIDIDEPTIREIGEINPGEFETDPRFQQLRWLGDQAMRGKKSEGVSEVETVYVVNGADDDSPGARQSGNKFHVGPGKDLGTRIKDDEDLNKQYEKSKSSSDELKPEGAEKPTTTDNFTEGLNKVILEAEDILKTYREASINENGNTLNLAIMAQNQLEDVFNKLSSDYSSVITDQQQIDLIQILSNVSNQLQHADESYQAVNANLNNTVQNNLETIVTSDTTIEEKQLAQTFNGGLEETVKLIAPAKLNIEFQYWYDVLANSNEYDGNDMTRNAVIKLREIITEVAANCQTRNGYLNEASILPLMAKHGITV